MSTPSNPKAKQTPDGLEIMERWRAAERRYDERLKELGIERGIPIADDAPRSQGFDDAWQCLQKELDEIRALLPARPRTPSGWEGPPPDANIDTVDDLIRFAEAELRQVHALGRSHHLGCTFVQMSAESLLNAHRWLLDAGIRERPFPQRPTNADDTERELANLLIWLDECHGSLDSWPWQSASTALFAAVP